MTGKCGVVYVSFGVIHVIRYYAKGRFIIGYGNISGDVPRAWDSQGHLAG